MTKSNDVSLSVIVIIGADRERAMDMLAALGSQTAVQHIETIVVDTIPDCLPLQVPTEKLRTTFIRLGQNGTWAQARYEGLLASNGTIVAFLEDHCLPVESWAEALIATYQEPWAAVGYAFRNGSPDSYLYRAIFMAEYGFWAEPALHGNSHYLPGNNVSYKRETLLSLGQDIKSLLSDDTAILNNLGKQGLGVCVAPRALVSHQTTGLSDALSGHFALARLSASGKIQDQPGHFIRRLAMAIVTLFLFPSVRALRLWWSLRNRRGLKLQFFASLPITYIIYQWAALGVSAGYLFGAGISRNDFDWAQLNAPRIRADSSK